MLSAHLLRTGALVALLLAMGCAGDSSTGDSDDDLTSSVKLSFVVAKDCHGKLPNETPLHAAISPAYVFTIQESALSSAGLSYKTARVHATRIADGKRYDLGAFSATDTLKFQVPPSEWPRSTIELDFRELVTSSTKADAQASVAHLYTVGVFDGNWLSDEWSMPVTCKK